MQFKLVQGFLCIEIYVLIVFIHCMSFVIASCHGNCETVSLIEPISQKHEGKMKKGKQLVNFPFPLTVIIKECY